ncbi:unnamed protein product [Caenorhabditis bovis]|uniref:Uncharacterized protein n=1 Tax=Caenorhabditis bovis TaxID=2654633 RepID=A0A8S1FB65_9PELO|nr:unnamed protein product [Caenorhabditis bovis]
MSSWYAYFGFNKGQQLDPVEEETSEASPQIEEKTVEDELAEAMNRLSPDQKVIVQDVLRRAETSRREAKVVVDAELMRSAYRKRATSGEDSFELRHSLVQMDSIPDNVITEMPGRRASEDTSEEEASSSNMRRRFQRMKSHLTTWFNSLDYDGDYFAIFELTGNKPQQQEHLEDLTMQYIDALSKAIMISSHIEYSHHVISSNPRFQLMCTRFCESIFALAYEQLTVELIDNEQRKRLNECCGRIAEEALQSAFYNLMSKTLPAEDDAETIVQEISLLHKSRSFENAKELDDYLQNINNTSTGKLIFVQLFSLNNVFDREMSPTQCYEVLENGVSEVSSNDSFEDPIVEVEELYYETDYTKRGPLRQITELDEDGETSSSSGSLVIFSDSEITGKINMNVEEYIQKMIDQVSEKQTDDLSEQSTSQESEVDKPFEILAEEHSAKSYSESSSSEIVDDTSNSLADWKQQSEELSSPATSGADFETSFDQEPVAKPVEEALTQEELDHIAQIQSMADQTFAVAPTRPPPPPPPMRIPTIDEPAILKQQSEQLSSPATSGADFETSFDQGPIAEPVEEALTQEELDHIAQIQSMADQTFAVAPSRPPPPPPPMRIPTIDEPAILKQQSEQLSSPATSGADFETSFDQGPIAEPVEEALTQEELDHIAQIQSMADQTFAMAPTRPPPPPPSMKDPTIDEPTVLKQQSEELSSPETSGADSERSSENFCFSVVSEGESPMNDAENYSNILLENTVQSLVSDSIQFAIKSLNPASVVDISEKPMMAEEDDWITKLVAESALVETNTCQFERSDSQNRDSRRPVIPPKPKMKRIPTIEVTAYFDDSNTNDRNSEEENAGISEKTDTGKNSTKSSNEEYFSELERDANDARKSQTSIHYNNLNMLQSEQLNKELQGDQILSHEAIKWIENLVRNKIAETAINWYDKPKLIKLNQNCDSYTDELSFDIINDAITSASGQTCEHESAKSELIQINKTNRDKFGSEIDQETMEDICLNSDLQQEVQHLIDIERNLKPDQNNAKTTEVNNDDYIPNVPFCSAQLSELPTASNSTIWTETEIRDGTETYGAHQKPSVNYEKESKYTTSESSSSLDTDGGCYDEEIMKTANCEARLIENQIQQIALLSSKIKSAKSQPPIPIRRGTIQLHKSIQLDENVKREITEEETCRQSFPPMRIPTIDEPAILKQQSEQLSSPATSGADFETSFDQEPVAEPVEEALTQEELDHIAQIQSMADQTFAVAPSRPPPPPPPMRIPTIDEPAILKQQSEQLSSPATSGADFKTSFDQEPVAEPVEEALTQEELDHIAQIQSMADQTFAVAPTRPPPPPPPMRIPTIDEPAILKQQSEQLSSPATSGADFKTSFDQEPVAEPVEEALTQEELDHIAQIQSMADQTFTVAPSRPPPPPPPMRIPTIDEPAILKQQSEQLSSPATSGADFETSFDQEPVAEPVEGSPDSGGA